MRNPGTREEPGTLTKSGSLFSLVPLVCESKTPGWLVQAQPPAQRGFGAHHVCVYYCRTCFKAACGGERGTVKDM